MMRHETARTLGIRARGRSELQKYREGKRLTPMESITANCYVCMGGYTDGKYGCGISDCPNYPLMPYRDIK